MCLQMLPPEIVDLIMSHKECIENVLPVAFPEQQKMYSVWIEYIKKMDNFCAKYPDMRDRVVRHVKCVEDKIKLHNNTMMLQSSIILAMSK